MGLMISGEFTVRQVRHLAKAPFSASQIVVTCYLFLEKSISQHSNYIVCHPDTS